jgi:hypothetical protein
MLFPAKVKMALVGLVVAGGAAAAALLGPAGTAVGQSSPPIQTQIQVNSPGTLVAKGAGVDVSVTASCSGQFVESGNIGISLTEAIGKNLATGSGSAGIDCTGTTQTITVVVVAQSGHAFAKGSAIASANISACTVDFSNCGYEQVQPVIKIRK